MTRRVWLAAFCLPWFGLVYLVTWWVTFPGKAAADRVASEVSAWSGGHYLVEMAEVGPWWLGLAASNLRVFNHEGRSADEPSTLWLSAEDARVRVGLLGLFRRQFDITASMTSGASTVDSALTVKMDSARSKGWTTQRLWIEAVGASFEDLGTMLPVPVVATGSLDVKVDVAGEGGMRSAVGTVAIIGKNVVISEITAEVMQGIDLGMEVPIDVLDLELEIKDGRARFSKGEISGPLFEAQLSGDVTLRDELLRSHVRVSAVIELRGDLERIGAFLGDAKWADGKLHYTCTGYITAPSCRPDRESSRRASRAASPATSGSTSGSDATSTDDDRARRRDEARERVRKRKEEREGKGATTAIPVGDDPVPAEDDDPPPVDDDPSGEEDLGSEDMPLEE